SSIAARFNSRCSGKTTCVSIPCAAIWVAMDSINGAVVSPRNFGYDEVSIRTRMLNLGFRIDDFGLRQRRLRSVGGGGFFQKPYHKTDAVFELKQKHERGQCQRLRGRNAERRREQNQ